jgi:transposase
MVPEQYQYLVDDRDKAVAAQEKAEAERDEAVAERDELKRRIAWLQRQVFGQKSERFFDADPNQPELGLELEESDEAKVETKTIPEHKRREKRRSTGDATLSWPEDLPVEEEVVDVPESERHCPRTGEELKVIGEDVVDRLARRPGSCYVRRRRYLKRANPAAPKSGVVRAASLPSFVEGGKFDESMLAWICCETFGFYQPLYRIAEKLKGEGIGVSRQTLSKVVIDAAEKLAPLTRELKRRTLAGRCLHVDESPVKVQAKGKCRQAYVWLYLAADPNAPPYHYYDFCRDRSQRHAREFLKEFDGTIHADAWSGYVAMDAEKKLAWSACWAHARRKFENAEDGDPQLRDSTLRRMQQLFLLERHAWKMDAAKRLRLRLDFELPIVDAIFDEVLSYRKKLLPKSALAGACDYLLSYRKNFERYLVDPDLRMDNNPAERGLRKLVLARKNFVFLGSDRGGEAMAGLLSLVQTCRAMDLNPFDYLDDVMRRIMQHNSQAIHELLPDQWLAAQVAEQ